MNAARCAAFLIFRMQLCRPVAAALLLLAACSGPDSAPPPGKNAQPARRLVTLAPNLTEIVVAIGAGDRLVGTDDFSNYPPPVAGLRKVGGLTPSIEAIVALEPDLVVAAESANAPALQRSLENVGIPLMSVRADRLDDVPAAMKRLGTALGVEAAASRAAGALRDGVESQRRVRSVKPRVLVVVWPDPLYVAGRNTYADDLLLVAGAENAVAPDVSGWPQYSLEAVVASNPDVIVLFGRKGEGERAIEALRRDPRWAQLGAVRDGMTFVVDEDRFSRPGPRLAEAAAELNAILDQAGAGR